MINQSDQERDLNWPKTPTAPDESILTFNSPPPSYFEAFRLTPPQYERIFNESSPPSYEDTLEKESCKCLNHARMQMTSYSKPTAAYTQTNLNLPMSTGRYCASSEHPPNGSFLPSVSSKRELDVDIIPDLKESEKKSLLKDYVECTLNQTSDFFKVTKIRKKALFEYSLVTEIEERDFPNKKIKPHVSSLSNCNTVIHPSNCSSSNTSHHHRRKIFDSKYSKQTHFPSSFLQRCECATIYEHEVSNERLNPIRVDGHPDIWNLSNQYLCLHQRLCHPLHNKIVSQKHSLSVIPVYRVTCESNTRRKKFYVVGTNHNIYKEAEQCAIV